MAVNCSTTRTCINRQNCTDVYPCGSPPNWTCCDRMGSGDMLVGGSKPVSVRRTMLADYSSDSDTIPMWVKVLVVAVAAYLIYRYAIK